MSIKKPTYATSVANQVRATGLGVSNGGTQGRGSTVFKGVGMSPGSGGLNSRGTGARPIVSKLPSAKASILAQPRAPMPSRGLGSKVGGAKPQFMNPSSSSGFSGSSFGVIPKPSPAPGASSAAAALASPVGGVVPGPLDYRNSEGYISGKARLDLENGLQRQSIADQLAENSRLYTKETADAKDAYGRGIETGEDSANRAGLLRSGAREVDNSDRFKQFNDVLAGFEESHGSVATAKLNQALEELKARQGLDMGDLERSARDEYSQGHESAPVATPAVAPVRDPNVLRFYQKGADGKYHIVEKQKSSLTQAQLKVAQASKLNQ